MPHSRVARWLLRALIVDRRFGDRRAEFLSRRTFVTAGLAATAGLLLSRFGSSASSGETVRASAAPLPSSLPVLRPPRLRPGDTVGIIDPSALPMEPDDRERVAAALERLGLRAKVSPHFGGKDDATRAADLHAHFRDPEVKALMPVRGGWGCARLLPLLDYGLIRRHPKVVIGFSDMAALLIGIHARTGLVTFHGPMGISSWDAFEVEHAQRVLFDPQPSTLANPAADPIETLRAGRARGRLFGGNLTVLTSMLGSPYVTSGRDLILFLEEVREPTSEVDRMLTQLEMGGVFEKARGVVFGQCTRCAPPMVDESLTLREVLSERVASLGVPAFTGALIGHTVDQLTVPLGVEVELDAARGTLRLLEGAVV